MKTPGEYADNPTRGRRKTEDGLIPRNDGEVKIGGGKPKRGNLWSRVDMDGCAPVPLIFITKSC